MKTQVQIPIDSFTDFVCDSIPQSGSIFRQPKCDGVVFEKVLLIKTYKGILSGGNKVVMELPCVRCVKCGAVHNMNEK
jgi:hypothetical protein